MELKKTTKREEDSKVATKQFETILEEEATKRSDKYILRNREEYGREFI